MSKRTETAYCAGLIDGEGCIRVKKTKPYRHLTGRINPSYGVTIHVRMVEEESIKFLKEKLGGWYWKEKGEPGTRKPLYCWQATDNVAEQILNTVKPFLLVKQEQVENALKFRKLQSNRKKYLTRITGYRDFPNQYGTVRRVANRAYSEEYIAECERFYLRSRELNA